MENPTPPTSKPTPFHLTPQCVRIKMTTNFQWNTTEITLLGKYKGPLSTGLHYTLHSCFKSKNGVSRSTAPPTQTPKPYSYPRVLPPHPPFTFCSFCPHRIPQNLLSKHFQLTGRTGEIRVEQIPLTPSARSYTESHVKTALPLIFKHQYIF